MKEHKKNNRNQPPDSDWMRIQEIQEELRLAKKIGKEKQETPNRSRKSKKVFFTAGICVAAMCILFIWIQLWRHPAPDSKNPYLEAVELVRVVDGDTIIVKYSGEEVRVRLLTVNCEESVHPDETRNNAEGEAASAFTKAYLEDYPVLYLQFDEAMYDRYDRLLAYVWLEDEVSIDSREDVEQYMFNAILLKEGYAETVVYEPNHRYAEWFFEIEEEAENRRN